MTGIEVSVNQQIRCIAAIDHPAVLTAIVRSSYDSQAPIERIEEIREQFVLTIGGLDCRNNTDLQWPSVNLKLGDAVQITVREIARSEISAFGNSASD